MTRWNDAGRLLAVAVLITLAQGCGSTGKKADVDETTTPTASALSYDAAVARADAYVQETLTSVLGSGAALEDLIGTNPSVAYCSDVSDPPKGTPVNVQKDYRVTGVDAGGIRALATSFEKHWGDAGWKHEPGSITDGSTTMSSDDFALQLSYAPSNQLISLSVQTPCVAPKDPDDPLATG